MATIYHYTTAAAFMGMMQNCTSEHRYLTMWATHAMYLNDPTEYQYGKNVCRKLLQDVEAELNILEDERLSKQMYSETMQGYFDTLDRGFSQQPSAISHGTPYIISFSRNRDSLPMWNTYAQRGNGIAIGFDERILKLDNRHISLKQCYYDVEDKDYTKVKTAIRMSYHMLKEESQNDPTIAYVRKIDLMLSLYTEVAAYIKHQGYKDEKEIRCRINKSEDILYRESNGLIIPYVETLIPFERVNEIIIGPTIDQERLKHSLHMLLWTKMQNHNIDVISSAIPYRG